MKPQELAEEIMKAIGTSDTVTAHAALDIARALVTYNRFHPDLSNISPSGYSSGEVWKKALADMPDLSGK